jgi:hypothetical protein
MIPARTTLGNFVFSLPPNPLSRNCRTPICSSASAIHLANDGNHPRDAMRAAASTFKYSAYPTRGEGLLELLLTVVPDCLGEQSRADVGRRQSLCLDFLAANSPPQSIEDKGLEINSGNGTRYGSEISARALSCAFIQRGSLTNTHSNDGRCRRRHGRVGSLPRCQIPPLQGLPVHPPTPPRPRRPRSRR